MLIHVNILLFYTFTYWHYIIEYVMPKDGLRGKLNCIYIYEVKMPCSGKLFKKIYGGQQVAQSAGQVCEKCLTHP